MESIYEDIIGTGVLFPIELKTNEFGNTGWYPVKGDVNLISNNLEAVFLHQIGTKFREEDFGTRIWECIEEPNYQALTFLVNQFMKEAFSKWESRVTYKSTEIQREGSRINLLFTYVINNSNSSKVGMITYDLSNNTLNI